MKRIALRKRDPTVIVHGFGSNLGKTKLGKLTSTDSLFHIEISDQDGNYVERYSTRSGVRVEDIGDKDGWKVTPSDVRRPAFVEPPARAVARPRSRKRFGEEYPINDFETLYVDVYEVGPELYVRAYRRKVTESGSIKDHPGLISFTRLRQFLELYSAEIEKHERNATGNVVKFDDTGDGPGWERFRQDERRRLPFGDVDFSSEKENEEGWGEDAVPTEEDDEDGWFDGSGGSEEEGYHFEEDDEEDDEEDIPW